jgi:tRNA (mo5U34)-methyltransferase
MECIRELFKEVPTLRSEWDVTAYADIVNSCRRYHLETEQWHSISYRIANLVEMLPLELIVDSNKEAVEVDSPLISTKLLKLIKDLINDLKPWRKGPFSIFGEFIDSEWRSNLKWERIDLALGGLRGKKVLDIGCNNGYYMFRMLSKHPEIVLGIDPSPRVYFQFQLLNALVRAKELIMEPIGIEDLHPFKGFFDVVLCMGILYHRRDQLGTLKGLADIMKSKGVLILETLVVGDDSPYCLCPAERYAMMRNVWFIPSIGVVNIWLQESGFSNIEVLADNFVTEQEQRRTAYASSSSLESFLDPENSQLTVEGYPAPRRIVVKATRSAS